MRLVILASFLLLLTSAIWPGGTNIRNTNPPYEITNNDNGYGDDLSDIKSAINDLLYGISNTYDQKNYNYNDNGGGGYFYDNPTSNPYNSYKTNVGSGSQKSVYDESNGLSDPSLSYEKNNFIQTLFSSALPYSSSTTSSSTFLLSPRQERAIRLIFLLLKKILTSEISEIGGINYALLDQTIPFYDHSIYDSLFSWFTPASASGSGSASSSSSAGSTTTPITPTSLTPPPEEADILLIRTIINKVKRLVRLQGKHQAKELSNLLNIIGAIRKLIKIELEEARRLYGVGSPIYGRTYYPTSVSPQSSPSSPLNGTTDIATNTTISPASISPTPISPTSTPITTTTTTTTTPRTLILEATTELIQVRMLERVLVDLRFGFSISALPEIARAPLFADAIEQMRMFIVSESDEGESTHVDVANQILSAIIALRDLRIRHLESERVLFLKIADLLQTLYESELGEPLTRVERLQLQWIDIILYLLSPQAFRAADDEIQTTSSSNSAPDLEDDLEFEF